MKNLKILAISVAAILVIIIVLQNTESVETKVLFTTMIMPRVVLLLVTFAVGLTTGLVLGSKLRGKKAAASA